MHHSNCTCRTCLMAAEQERMGSTWPYVGEVYGSMEFESPFSEAEELELAMELLSVSSEAEMDQFLGKLFRGIGRGLKKVGRFIGRRVLPALGKGLKSLAKVALPIAGKVLGSFIPIPGVGTALGGALGTAVSRALELEFSELEADEVELESARRFIRIATTAAHRAAAAAPDLDPGTAVNEALMGALQQHLPYLDRGHAGRSARFPASLREGRWIRRGSQITVFGA